MWNGWRMPHFLNKLFMISANERNYQTLLTDRNLLAVVRERQSYVFSILPRSLPKVLVPSEHHMMKDLPFYEVACVTDAKACQDRLDQIEKKRQEENAKASFRHKPFGH